VLVDRGETTTSLFRLNGGGPALLAYCIELNVRATPGASYREVGWESAWLGDARKLGQITWILAHSFPTLSVETLARQTGLTGLTSVEAVAGTQAAIWRISNGARLSSATAARVRTLASWLTGPRNTGATEPSTPGLSLSPAQIADSAGKRLGPIVVRAQGVVPAVTLKAPPGVTIWRDGDRVWLDVPDTAAAGVAEVRASGTGTIPAGRVFVGSRGSTKSQTLVLAQARKVSVAATSRVSWVAQARPGPAAEVVDVCAPEGVLIKLSNTGGAPASFTVTGVAEPISVAAGSSTDVVVPVGEDADYDIAVASEGYSRTFAGNRDCARIAQPSAEATPSCVDGGLSVRLGNSGDGPAEFVVADLPVTVPPSETRVVVVPVAEDTAYNVTVRAGQWTRSFEGILDCVAPAPPSPTTSPSASPSQTPPAAPAPSETPPSPSAASSSTPPLPAAMESPAVASAAPVQQASRVATPAVSAIPRSQPTAPVAAAALPATGGQVSRTVSLGLCLVLLGAGALLLGSGWRRADK
jgi:TQXA domain-containing protein